MGKGTREGDRRGILVVFLKSTPMMINDKGIPSYLCTKIRPGGQPPISLFNPPPLLAIKIRYDTICKCLTCDRKLMARPSQLRLPPEIRK